MRGHNTSDRCSDLPVLRGARRRSVRGAFLDRAAPGMGRAAAGVVRWPGPGSGGGGSARAGLRGLLAEEQVRLGPRGVERYVRRAHEVLSSTGVQAGSEIHRVRSVLPATGPAWHPYPAGRKERDALDPASVRTSTRRTTRKSGSTTEHDRARGAARCQVRGLGRLRIHHRGRQPGVRRQVRRWLRARQPHRYRSAPLPAAGPAARTVDGAPGVCRSRTDDARARRVPRARLAAGRGRRIRGRRRHTCLVRRLAQLTLSDMPPGKRWPRGRAPCSRPRRTRSCGREKVNEIRARRPDLPAQAAAGRGSYRTRCVTSESRWGSTPIGPILRARSSPGASATARTRRSCSSSCCGRWDDSECRPGAHTRRTTDRAGHPDASRVQPRHRARRVGGKVRWIDETIRNRVDRRRPVRATGGRSWSRRARPDSPASRTGRRWAHDFGPRGVRRDEGPQRFARRGNDGRGCGCRPAANRSRVDSARRVGQGMAQRLRERGAEHSRGRRSGDRRRPQREQIAIRERYVIPEYVREGRACFAASSLARALRKPDAAANDTARRRVPVLREARSRRSSPCSQERAGGCDFRE